MKRCENGHVYDESTHNECPHCGVQSLWDEGMDDDTSPTNVADNSDVISGTNIGDDLDGKTIGMGTNISESSNNDEPADSDSGKTVMFNPLNENKDSSKKETQNKSRGNVVPVVGWLVCMEGPNKGQDYRIHHNRNFIGRNPKMDINVQGDPKISRSKHAEIIFDIKSKKFLINIGESNQMLYLNGDVVLNPREIKSYDEIEIGDSLFVFVPFCGEKKSWS